MGVAWLARPPPVPMPMQGPAVRVDRALMGLDARGLLRLQDERQAAMVGSLPVVR